MASGLTLNHPVRIFLAACGLLAVPGVAVAQECAQNANCPAGFTCEITGATTCGAAPACPPDMDCPPSAPCESIEYRSCVPGPCAGDADCAEGMVCVEHTEGECTVSAQAPCAPDTDCGDVAPPEETCTERTVTQCTPKWALPCAEAADCGEGFDCVEELEHWCNGSSGGGTDGDSAGSEDPPSNTSSGMGGASGFAAPAPPEGGSAGTSSGGSPNPGPDPECGETRTGHFYCQPRGIPCEANTDCPSDWLCKEQDVPPTANCVEPEPAPGSGVSAPMCPPPEPVEELSKLCVPPYYDLDFPGRAGSDDPGTVTNEGGEQGPTGEPPPSAPTVSNPQEPLPPGNGNSDNTADPDPAANGASTDASGCQMNHGSTSGGAALLLGLVGAFGAARRRRG